MFRLGVLSCWRTLSSSCKKPPVLKTVTHESLVSLNVQFVRNYSFFNRLTQQELWKGTTSVSNAGKRKGRGKGTDRKTKRNLNVGKKVGEGVVKVQWPGLNIGVLRDTQVNEIKTLPSEGSPKSDVVDVAVRRRKKIHPLDRGWSGGRVAGRKLGPPDAVQDETFENFQSIVLESKITIVQTALLGKKRRYFSLVGIGNGNGVCGFGVAKVIDGRTSLRLAKNRATKKLLTIDLIEKHTVNHDFFCEYGKTRVFVFKKPKGYGLVCHRLIKSVCTLIGIEDLHAKVEGPCIAKHILRAFIVGLLRQKTYQEIADEKKLNLVEFREESHNFPLLLASPKECLTEEEYKKNPVLFEEYIMGDRLVLKRDPRVPFYEKLPSWNTYLKRNLYKRNHHKVKLDLMVKYGYLRSHLTDIYPECVHSLPREEKKN